MRYLTLILLFCASLGAHANDFRVCGSASGKARASLPELDLGAHPDVPFGVFLDWEVEGDAAQGLGRRCGGSLIAPRWVLTARHCVGDKRWRGLRVFHASRGDKVTGLAAICLPKGLPFPHDDLALLWLSEPLEGPFPTLAQDLTPALPQRAHIARWPVRNEIPQSQQLLSDLIITARTDMPILRGHMPGLSGRVPCGGESGSPVISGAGEVVGVLTAISGSNGGPPDCNDLRTQIFATPTADWANWIKQTMQACAAEPARCSSPE